MYAILDFDAHILWLQKLKFLDKTHREKASLFTGPNHYYFFLNNYFIKTEKKTYTILISSYKCRYKL